MGRQEKWNRLIDAFSGKGTAFSMPEYPKGSVSGNDRETGDFDRGRLGKICI